ncbi:MAG: hypothetical protein LBH19_00255 [Dysgonamonadaceae bacterium]|jgi:hypothetical protein|nr:hypothetical protein [Dysgonamonadaceae bacterium]
MYINEDGKITQTHQFEEFSEKDEIELYASGNERSFYSNYAFEYVVIDGKKAGKSPALRAWYDKEKNSFIWNSIEGKELVVYEYKLD